MAYLFFLLTYLVIGYGVATGFAIAKISPWLNFDGINKRDLLICVILWPVVVVTWLFIGLCTLVGTLSEIETKIGALVFWWVK
jgi:hypothetical protein